jgi:hypothetical protein
MLAAVLDGMAARGYGRVVNITSSVVRHPIDVQGLSVAARAGLHGLVSTLVRAHVGRNVTINNILPGPFATDRLISNFTFRAKQEGISPEEALAARRAELPARRFGEPQELGQLCAYLCSAHAGYISGQSILIDGGAHPQPLRPRVGYRSPSGLILANIGPGSEGVVHDQSQKTGRGPYSCGEHCRAAGPDDRQGRDDQGGDEFRPEDPRSDLDHGPSSAASATWCGTRCSRWTKSCRSSPRWSTSGRRPPDKLT